MTDNEQTNPGPTTNQAESQAPDTPHEPLRLPRGAFLALTKTGGADSTPQAVVVYPDGRAAYTVHGVNQKDYSRLRRVLNDAQVLGLRKLLDQTGFWKAESGSKENANAVRYEIAARLGQRVNSIELYEGNVPERLEPLIERLTKLLPET
jgi:hypothetical protein